jgi:hypothetical protein
MSGRLHDVIRQGRILARHIRHSRLVLGDSREAVIRERLAQVFKTTNRFLNDLGVEYWLVYGTLLGYYRNGDLIRGDWDIDFGAHEQEYEKIWTARHRLPVGFRMYDTSHKHRGPKLYVTWKGWEADIYFYKEIREQVQSYEKSRYLNETQPCPRAFIYPVKPAVFLGEPTSIPNDPLAYLLHTYHYIGEDGVRDPKTGYWRPRNSDEG